MHKEIIGQTEFTFRLADSEALRKKIYHLRYLVYSRECGFIKEEDYPDEMEHDKYDPYSLQFVAEDYNGVIGTIRLILDNPAGFPLEECCRNKLNFDLNEGVGGAYLYLKYTDQEPDRRNRSQLASPIVDLRVEITEDEHPGRIRNYKALEPELNKGAGGRYIWLFKKHL